MVQGKMSWSAPMPANALRYMLAGGSAGLLSVLMFAGIVVMVFTA